MDKPYILIADDERGIRLLAREFLGQKFGVLEASDGQEATDIANKYKPALILMDILMPNVDGYTACSRIKMNPATETIPVVMITALGHELNRKLAESSGADGYLIKPFLEEELFEIISKFLEIPK